MESPAENSPGSFESAPAANSAPVEVAANASANVGANAGANAGDGDGAGDGVPGSYKILKLPLAIDSITFLIFSSLFHLAQILPYVPPVSIFQPQLLLNVRYFLSPH